MVEQSEIITHQPKTIENPNIVDIKSAFIEHSKTSLKVSKAISQAEKFSQVNDAGKNSDSILYTKTKTMKIFWVKKNAKKTKRSHASSYSFYIILQFRDTESAIKNKLIDLLSELRGFIFVKALVLEFKKNREL